MIKKLSILLVEDDDVAAESVQRNFKKMNLNLPVVVAENGLEAINILKSRHPTLSLEKPYVILLDLNMPEMNGFEFLECVRDDSDLKDSIIFVLTTSNADSDRSKAYHKNIAGYMVKSEVGPQFSKLIALLDAYKKAIEPSVQGE